MRVAVVAGPAPGHAFPAASLAVALRRRGHDVLMLTGPDWRPSLQRDGVMAELLPLLEADPRDVDFGFRIWGRAREMAPAIANRLSAWRPDVVVADTLTVGGSFAAFLIDVPLVELVPHPLQDISRFLPAPGTGLAPGRNPVTRARDAWTRRMHARSLSVAAGQRAAGLRTLGIRADARPSLRLIATLPGLEFERPDWPADAVLVGPLEWDPASVELALPPGDGPLIFISESTAVTGVGGLLDAAIVGLSGAGGRVVCTRFSAYDGPLPPWVAVGPGLQAPLLAESKVVVSGAGHGMVAKALVRGLPSVLVPGGGEQWDNAQRVRRLGAGVVLRPGRLTPARLRAAVLHVLGDDRYARSAARIAQSSKGIGPEFAAKQVESVT